MTHLSRLPMLAGLVLALVVAALPRPATAETPVGSNVDSRLVLALSVNQEAAQAWLPEGWTSAPFDEGPFAGANLLLVLIDQQVAYDAEGAPAATPTRRAAVLVLTGAAGDDHRIFVARIYSTDADASPYGNTVAAAVSRQASLAHLTDQPREQRELWTVAPDAGGSLTVTLGYEVGALGWSEGEAIPYSAADPEFHRIYRFEQLAEVVMSVPLGRNFAGGLSLTTSIPELAPLFDDSEQVVAVAAIPVYVRDIFLP